MNELKDKRVLVVDDEEMLREVLTDALQMMGADVLAAPNGTVALALIRQSRPQLVITDIRMPDGDGLFLLAAIMSDPLPRPQVIVCTAFGDIDESEALARGAYALFMKPFEWRSFRKALVDAVTNP